MKRLLPFFALLALLSSCGADKHLHRGDKYYELGEYYEASLEYAKAYSKTPAKQKDKKALVAYKVGESNRHLGYSAKALAGYRNAARYGLRDSLTLFYLGEMQRMAKDYRAAQESYTEYLDSFPSDTQAQIGLQAAQQAADIIQRNSLYTIHEFRLFNATYADYSPCLSADETQVIFSSTRRDATGDDASEITGMKNGDLFYSTKDEQGQWQRPEILDETINTEYDEGTPCLSPDGKTLYFTRCAWDATYPRMAQIFQAQRSDAKWGTATLVSLTSDTLSSFAHPAVSPDGLWLYFVSDMPGGFGGLDIWRAPMNEHGIGAVENLGPTINSPGDEMFPTFRPNGDLYYSSNGRGGLGGLDIYCATPDSLGDDYIVSHLPYPVNSNGDDFGMTFEQEHNRGFFSTNRTNRRGWDKIYTFEHPEITQTLTGWVYEQDGYELTQATVYMVGDDGTQLKLGLKLDGSFTQPIHDGVRYALLATCPGYMNYRNELYIPQGTGSVDTTLQFPLPSLNIPVLVRNVFYEFDKAEILPQSIPALEGLADLLRTNSSIQIELSSHCDYRGSEEYNLALSQRRAQSVVDYLTSHGIPQERVVAKGYGKTRPKIITPKFAERYPFLHAGDILTPQFIDSLPPALQDSCHALNRRTEFSVLGTTYGILDAQGNIINPSLQTDTIPADTIPTDTLIPIDTLAAPLDTIPADSIPPQTKSSKTTKTTPKTRKPTRQDSDSEPPAPTKESKSTAPSQRTRVQPLEEEFEIL